MSIILKKLKTIKYISETSIEEMIKDIVGKNMNLDNVISGALEARKEFGLKVGLLIEEVKSLKENT
ncbi:hypothetical protein BSK59_13700 [Paenibacillus odorifer]|uniref:hypothetical protein n=1 Tax=Paenibacillus odorifer TaxID=189426 RepID=UPI00096EAB93|nr:hypothetical protein [Paenibacillus odorifer]OME55525.1 hypothetical protein BSK59_13700 [Paenibacillus odorifer]